MASAFHKWFYEEQRVLQPLKSYASIAQIGWDAAMAQKGQESKKLSSKERVKRYLKKKNK